MTVHPDPIAEWDAWVAAPSGNPWEELADAVTFGTRLRDALVSERAAHQQTRKEREKVSEMMSRVERDAVQLVEAERAAHAATRRALDEAREALRALRVAAASMVAPSEEALRLLSPHKAGYDRFAEAWDTLRGSLTALRAALAGLPDESTNDGGREG